MELATDIMAILGWGLFGFCMPTHIATFRDGDSFFGGETKAALTYSFASAVSLFLIAASLVLE